MNQCRVTSVTLAQKLGLSQATISMALRDDPKISLKTRDRVKKAAIRFNYVTNYMARSMKTGRTKILGMIVPNITQAFYSNAINIIEKLAKEEGYYCFLTQSHSTPQTLENEIQSLLERGVEGLFIYPLNPVEQQKLYFSLLKRNVPFVLCDEPVNQIEIPCVMNDHIQIGVLATNHLIERGHRRIVCLTGSLGTTSALGRLEGYRRALKKAKIPIDQNLIWEGTYKGEDGSRCIDDLLSRDISFTALFASNDETAIHAIRSLRDHGINIPRDVSVIGVSNSAASPLIDPPLTTIDQCPDEIAKEAFGLLMEQIHSQRSRSLTRIIPPRLILRQSTAEIRP